MPTSLSPQQLVAHRGYQKKFPENTALSVSKAIEAGALFVEIDIQMSLDQHPIVFHDLTLKRVSGGSGTVHQLTLQELTALPACEPKRLGNAFLAETISPLARIVEIVCQHPAVTLFVELKEESIDHFGAELMLERVCDILQPIQQRAVLISFDYAIIEMARARGWPLVGAVLREWNDIHSPLLTRIAGDYTFVDHHIIPRSSDLSHLKTRLVAYEVGTVTLAESLAAGGVHMLETFDIEGLLATSPANR